MDHGQRECGHGPASELVSDWVSGPRSERVWAWISE